MDSYDCGVAYYKQVYCIVRTLGLGRRRDGWQARKIAEDLRAEIAAPLAPTYSLARVAS